jgi:uncharacterized membrane protein
MTWIVIEAWMEFAVRWLHVVTAISWIGSSFYFIALDLGLRRPPGLAQGVQGEEWQVHGGGFYHIRKYTVAPDSLPDHLTWFKWESYATWLSGLALLVLVYHLGADLFLIDPRVLELPVTAAVALSLGSLAVGWLAYDLLCRSPLSRRPTALMLALLVLILGASWGYAQIFSGRAALLHLGAFTATIMTANVFLIIIPNQKIVVADLRAGRTPDPALGKTAKLRSTHNNYLTLPVVFLMLSNHYPLAFSGPWNWLIGALVFLMGVAIRNWFNARHAGGRPSAWNWVAAALVLAAIIALSMQRPEPEETVSALPPTDRFAAAPGFAEVADIVAGRCAMCHAAEPGWGDLAAPPKGVLLVAPEDVARHARAIYLHAGITTAMPPGNLSWMEPAERAAIVAWYRAATEG